MNHNNIKWHSFHYPSENITIFSYHTSFSSYNFVQKTKGTSINLLILYPCMLAWMKVKVCGLPYMLLQKWTNLLFLQKNKVYTLTNFIMERTTTCIIKNKKKIYFKRELMLVLKLKGLQNLPLFVHGFPPHLNT